MWTDALLINSSWLNDTTWGHSSESTLATQWMAWRHQAITWPNVKLSSKVFCCIHLRATSQNLHMNFICTICIWHQAITWSNAGKLFIGLLGTIHTFSFKKIHLLTSSGKWRPFCLGHNVLTHWGWVTHICIGNLTIIGLDNGLSPGRRQAIIWTNAGILLIRQTRNKLQWNVDQNSNIFIHENAFESVLCEMASILSRPQCVNGLLSPDRHNAMSSLTGPRLNIKTVLSMYGDFHVKDKTAVRTSYL